MLIKNLKLSFVRQEGDKIILQADNGAEIFLPDYLLEQFTEHDKPVFLSMDYQPTPSADENKKEVLNDLLNKK
jgi:hypothetical protein